MAHELSKKAELDFGRIDLADAVDGPPVVFHEMRVPCACGRSLAERRYAFYPSTIHITGICSVCGPQTALFAPYMNKPM